MKKLFTVILLLTSIASVAYFVAGAGGNTTTLPGSSTSYTPQFRYTSTAVDSLKQIWVYSGSKWNRWYTATEVNLLTFQQSKIIGLQDSLLKKINNDYSNVAIGAIPINRLAARTISGISLGNNLANLTSGRGFFTFTYNGSSAATAVLDSTKTYTWVGQNYTGKVQLAASTTGTAGINYGTGTAPTSPVNGDMWFTSSNWQARVAGATWNVMNANLTQNVTGQKTFTVAPIVPTGTPYSGSTNAASEAYVDAAVANAGRGRVVLSANVTAILNYDYLNNTTTQYTITPPTTTGFANDGSKIITGLSTGSGGIRVSCPSGYTIQTPSGNVTPGTGFATIGQNQKFQLIPVGSNAYYLQPLNGSITVS